MHVGERAVPRLRELAPPRARGSQEAGFTQPRDHSLAQLCILYMGWTNVRQRPWPLEQAKFPLQSSPQVAVVSSLPSPQLGTPLHFHADKMH